MNKVYIISRYRARTKYEREFNVEVARHYARQIILECKLPVVPHLYYPQFLNDDNEQEREFGLELGIQALRESDEYLLVIVDGVISEGMQAEIKEISKLGLTGRIIHKSKREMMECMKAVV